MSLAQAELTEAFRMTLRKNWQLIYALTLVLVVGRTWAEEKKPSKPATAPKCCAETQASPCPHGCAGKCGSSSVPKSSKLVTRIHPLAAFFEAREYMEEMETPASALMASQSVAAKHSDL